MTHIAYASLNKQKFQLNHVNSHKFPKFLCKVSNLEHFKNSPTKVSMQSFRKVSAKLPKLFHDCATPHMRLL